MLFWLVLLAGLILYVLLILAVLLVAVYLGSLGLWEEDKEEKEPLVEKKTRRKEDYNIV